MLQRKRETQTCVDSRHARDRKRRDVRGQELLLNVETGRREIHATLGEDLERWAITLSLGEWYAGRTSEPCETRDDSHC
jgi:hypothetical protein